MTDEIAMRQVISVVAFKMWIYGCGLTAVPVKQTMCSSNSIGDTFVHVFYEVFPHVSTLCKVPECWTECKIELPKYLSPEAEVLDASVPFHLSLLSIFSYVVWWPQSPSGRSLFLLLLLKCEFTAVDRQPCQTDSVQLMDFMKYLHMYQRYGNISGYFNRPWNWNAKGCECRSWS